MNRYATGDEADSRKQQVDVSLCFCFSTHTLLSCAAGEWAIHYWNLSVSSLRCVGLVVAW